jgi:5,6-dimethylbenzimidazole synthase
VAHAPYFDALFRATLADLFLWRRDVRRFRRDALPDGLLQEFLSQACLSPSVGFSQPWRWVMVDDPERRAAIVGNFQEANRLALSELNGQRAALYARLKLAGLVEAPVHLAVFVDPETELGHGLGRRTMPEMLPYSAVCAVHTLWLTARAHGVGMGWVSILDPASVPQALDVPERWKLVAYLCLGYPEEEQAQPELEREGWAERQAIEATIVQR